jgi:hypothetical protein
MKKLQSAKIYLFLAALLFVAKPFLGFEMFSKLRPPAEESIFIKTFSKRRPEYSEDNSINLFEVQKKAIDLLPLFFSGISFLLSILFPLVITAGIKISKGYLCNIQLSVFNPTDSWLLNGYLLI